MKIAITTWFGGPNAGTYFQLMGLYEYLKNRGHEVKVINYMPQDIDFIRKGIYYYASQLPSLVRSQIRSRKERAEMKSIKDMYKDEIQLRDKKFRVFYSRLDFTDAVKTESDFNKLNELFDCFIVGSDQVWNPSALNRRYLLDYVTSGHIKASFSPSVGTGNILGFQKKMYKKYLSSFDFLSTRENKLALILSTVLSKNVLHLLDPSMLYPKEEYIKLSRLPEELQNVDYVLCYFIGGYDKFIDQARKYAMSRGCKLVVMTMFSQDYYIEDAIIYKTAGPSEFLGLINNAKAVFTASFHCTIFSILFNKDLYVLNKPSYGKSSDISLRYREQLETYGMQHRLIDYDKAVTSYNLARIDYEHANRIFANRLKESTDYLNQFV